MGKELKITSEKVLQVAKENPNAAKVLEGLFPEVFVDNKPFCKVGSLFTRVGCSGDYAVVAINGEVCIINIDFNYMWDVSRNLPLSSLSDRNRKTLTLAEFKKLSGKDDVSGFIFKDKIYAKEYY